MTLEARMRRLAFANTTLQGFLGNELSTFRWFYIQDPFGVIGVNTCVRVLTVGQETFYAHGARTRLKLLRQRLQFDVIDKKPSVAAECAAAIDKWLETADFVTNGAFSSPPVLSLPGSNFKLNERGGLDYETQRPTPVVSLDYRIFTRPI